MNRKIGFWLASFLIIATACTREHRLPGSTHLDWQFGSLTIDALEDAPVQDIQGILVDYTLQRTSDYAKAFNSAQNYVAYFAYLVLSNGDTVHFWDNRDHLDSMSGFLALDDMQGELKIGPEQLFIQKSNMMLNPGKYNGTLTIEARLRDAPDSASTPNIPVGKSIFWEKVPISFTQPQLTEYVVSSVYFAVNEKVVDPYSFDWPQARPDLFFMIYKPCSEVLVGDWNIPSRTDWRATEWLLAEDSLRFMLAKGDKVAFAVYDFDNWDANDFLGDFWLDLDALANKGQKKMPDFGQVKDLRFTWKSRVYKR